MWASVAALLTDVRAASDVEVAAVGIGSAGPIDVPAGTVSPINITEWHRFPIVSARGRRDGSAGAARR